MPSILPAEKHRTTAREQFLANLLLARTKEQVITALRELTGWRSPAIHRLKDDKTTLRP